MNNDYDAELRRLLSQMPEPTDYPDEQAFTARVAKKITLRRKALRLRQALLAALALAILAALTPWLVSLTGIIVLSSNLLAKGVVALLFSPAGWAIGSTMGLLVFLKAR